MKHNRANHLRNIDLIKPSRSDYPDALLSASEEKELARAIADGDKAAKDRMILANLGLVRVIARQYLGRGLELKDLVGEGHLGLIRAVEEFDTSFDTRFSTYAAYWIRESIRHALINTTATIRIPAHMVSLLTKWNREERRLMRERDQAPHTEEVSGRLGLSGRRQSLLTDALRAARLRSHGESSNVMVSITSAVSGNPGDAIVEEEERKELLGRLDALDSRERAVLTYRFGLGGGVPMTWEEVGRRINVTREWARRLELRALGKLRDGRSQSLHQAAEMKARAT